MISFIFVVCIFFNKFISIDIKKGEINKGYAKIRKYLLIAFLAIIPLSFSLNVAYIIPQSIVRLYGWGDIRSATLMVDYKGCQVFDKYHIKVEESCLKSEDTYRVNNVSILSALGKNYLLKCHREVGAIERYHSRIQDGSGQNSFSDEIELTLPASSIVSWSRAGG
jgi:hypothetical protein